MDDNKKSVKGDGGFIGGLFGGGGQTSGGQYIPREDENTLVANTHANIIDMLCEGEIGGPAVNDSWIQSTYLNEIPATTYNGVTIEANNGTSTQEYLRGFDTVETTNDVNINVTIAGGAITRTITDSNVDDAKVTISIPTLLSQTDKGDVLRTTVQLRISVTPDNGAGAKQTVISEDAGGKIYGKCVTEYRKQYVIEDLLQYGSAPWVITVERITADSGTGKLQNLIKWYSYTEVIQVKMRYYDRAVVGVNLNSAEFGNRIPTRAYRINGRIIKIPDNYNPVTRTYSGDWGGTFTTGVTNNPAWIVYDLLTDPDIGIGLLIDEAMVDKWSLYTIAQYCDGEVSYIEKDKDVDGMWVDTPLNEPRFSFNGVLESRNQALSVITNLCSSFRGYPVWRSGQITFVQDAPITSPPRPVGLSNVTEDGFANQGIPKRDRHTLIKVSWNNPDLLGKMDVLTVIDDEGIKNFGYNEMDFGAMGCTSRSEAVRRGRYVLDTDVNAREGVKFAGGYEWADASPGTLIEVQDPNYAGETWDGRVLDSTSNTTTSLYLDKPLTFDSSSTYTMTIQQYDDEPLQRVLTNSDETTNVLTWAATVPDIPFVGAMLVISVSTLQTRKYVIVSLTEMEAGYNVLGIEYDGDKYARIEDGITYDKPHDTGLLASELSPPSGIACEGYSYVDGDDNNRKYGIQISWIHSTDPRTSGYEVRYKPLNDSFLGLGTTVENSIEWKDVEGNTYDIEVRGYGPGLFSEWVTFSNFTINAQVSDINPPTNLDTLDGGGVWSGRDCTIDWTASAGSSFDATSNPIFTSVEVGDSNVSHYRIEVRKTDTTLLRTVDTDGNTQLEFTYLYGDNVDDNSNVPLRALLFYVYTVDLAGGISSTYDSVTATNPAPDMSSTTPTVTPDYGFLQVDWTNVNDNDMSHYKVYLDTSNPPTTLIDTVSYPVNSSNVPGLDAGTDYYAQIEPFDLFGAGTKSLVPGAEQIDKIPGGNVDVDADLSGTITQTDSDGNSAATLFKLYDGALSSDGVTYTLSGTDKWIQYQFGLESYVDRITLWTSNANGQVYVAYGDDGTNWTWLSGEADHTLDVDGKLISAADDTTAATNYWQLMEGINVGLFPSNIVARYVRLYFTGTYTTVLYEMVPARELIAEMASIGKLSAISADVGLLTAGRIESEDGQMVIDLDNDVMTVEDEANEVRVRIGKIN